jgi:hypothetical protein
MEPNGGSAYTLMLQCCNIHTQERMDVEAAAMQLVYRCCPAHVPRLLAYDAAQSILTMECCPPPHQKLLFCIRQGQVRRLTG